MTEPIYKMHILAKFVGSAAVEKMRQTLPPHMHEGLTLYLLHGLEPGSFLSSVLRNSLVGAAATADHINQQSLFEWAQWLYCYAPTGCYGTSEKVSRWCKSGGFLGQISEATNDQ